MKKLAYIAFSMLALSTLSFMYLIYLLILPFNVVTLDENPIRVNPKVVCSGATIELDLKFTKHKNITPIIDYYLINDNIVKIDRNNLNRPVGKQKRKLILDIPKAHEGKHVIQIQLEYPINRIRSIHHTWQTELFDIKNCETQH